jgi:hypothetical protein
LVLFDNILTICYGHRQSQEANMWRRAKGLTLLGLLVMAGCGTEALESGYKPRALKDSPAMRRSYYANPFTLEARAPQLEKEQEFEARRPHPGY